MGDMVFWNKHSAVADWRQAFLVEGVFRASPDADGWTLAQLNAEHDVFELIPADEAFRRYSDAHRQPVAEITLERFNDMLEVLPPLDWHFNESGGAQSFKLAEMYCGDITDIFAKYEGRYFQLRDRVTLAHRDIIALVRVSLAA